MPERGTMRQQRLTRKEKVALSQLSERPDRANNKARRKAKGTCQICGLTSTNAVVVKGKPFTDKDGNEQQAADSLYHRDCYRMQNKGLFSTGPRRTLKDSTGQSCSGCGSIIEPGDKHAHRNGFPYHKECLI